ncbi:ABC1 kinase family protein [Actinomadura harenae]|uniref:AarF/ABC1/UbiB kinase family protein n=1 Tax=Actinomadura harenae TaxID=2483351 RepID=A0A3M2LAA2_9ACTN|nr:AarF/ABC1/UbiB kinase family protein [Actinomadura harenae]RMI34511.1 AarF/ABC1/UbiB kinase family protein [Actinomadura harenae]
MGSRDGTSGSARERFPVRRCVRVVLVCVPAVPRIALAALVPGGRPRAARVADEVAGLLERLGGAFVKVGQLLATRVDLVGEPFATALGRLHDDVRIDAAPPLPERFRDWTARPVAGGSVAVVYRAWPPEDGPGGPPEDGPGSPPESGPPGDGVGVSRSEPVALKVKRPGVAAEIAGDLALLRRAARPAARLPGLRRVPLAEILDELGGLLLAQLDFRAEAANLARLRDALAGEPDVLVPAPLPEWCDDEVIAMEFVPGLDRRTPGRLPPEERRARATTLVRAVFRLLFVDGLVHVDLHHGNVYFLPDGRVVLLDAGLVRRFGAGARRGFAEFFGGMVRGDGDVCADALLASVRGAGRARDAAAFRREVAELVARNAGATAGEFRLPAFCLRLFDLQRRHGLYAEPEFAFPMLSLLAVEGTVRRDHPAMDFQLEAAPYALEGLLVNP